MFRWETGIETETNHRLLHYIKKTWTGSPKNGRPPWSVAKMLNCIWPFSVASSRQNVRALSETYFGHWFRWPTRLADFNHWPHYASIFIVQVEKKADLTAPKIARGVNTTSTRCRCDWQFANDTWDAYGPDQQIRIRHFTTILWTIQLSCNGNEHIL